MSSGDDYRANLDLFIQGHFLPVLAVAAVSDLKLAMDQKDYAPETAFAMLVHEEIEQGEEAKKRTLDRLQDLDFRKQLRDQI